VGRVSLTAGYGRSYLAFGDANVVLERLAVVGTSDLFLGKYTLTLGVGGVPTGTIHGRQDASLGSGTLGSAALSWRVVDPDEVTPFVVLGATLAGLVATTEGDAGEVGTWRAVDFRFGATAGKTFDWFTPYVAARVFGGPIFWTRGGETDVGGDRFHVQLALGAVAELPAGFDLFAEVAPIAEQGLFGGVGWRY
jgi:hypothetical protein